MRDGGLRAAPHRAIGARSPACPPGAGTPVCGAGEHPVPLRARLLCGASFARLEGVPDARAVVEIGSIAMSTRSTAMWLGVSGNTSLEMWCRRRSGWRSSGLTSSTWHAAASVPGCSGTATNVLRRHWRTEERRLRAYAAVASTPDQTCDPLVAVEAAVDAQRRLARLVDAVCALSPDDRDLLVLTAWEGMSSGESAAVLGVPAGTVRSRSTASVPSCALMRLPPNREVSSMDDLALFESLRPNESALSDADRAALRASLFAGFEGGDGDDPGHFRDPLAGSWMVTLIDTEPARSNPSTVTDGHHRRRSGGHRGRHRRRTRGSPPETTMKTEAGSGPAPR